MSLRRPLRVLTALTGAVALTASAAFAVGLSDPIPAPIPPAGVDIALQTVASGLESPVAAAVAPGDGHDLFVADQNGMLWGVNVHGHGHRHDKWLVVDLSGFLVDNLAKVIPGLPYDERGLLGVAFDPHFRSNGLVHTFTSENPTTPPDFTTQPGVTPGGGQAVVSEWAVQDPDVKRITVDPASRLVLMRVDKPQFNHNGGELAFGPAGCCTSRWETAETPTTRETATWQAATPRALPTATCSASCSGSTRTGTTPPTGSTGSPRTTRSSVPPGPTRSGPTASGTPTGSPSTAGRGDSWWQTSGRTTSKRSMSSWAGATTAGRSRRAPSCSTTVVPLEPAR